MVWSSFQCCLLFLVQLLKSLLQKILQSGHFADDDDVGDGNSHDSDDNHDNDDDERVLLALVGPTTEEPAAKDISTRSLSIPIIMTIRTITTIMTIMTNMIILDQRLKSQLQKILQSGHSPYPPS